VAIPVVLSLLAATHSRMAALLFVVLSVIMMLLAQMWALSPSRA
jgi:hypothetical protein